MKISEILKTGKRTLSFEVFPPKKSADFDTVREATERIAALKPDYMSVTFGAGGTGARYTLPIAANIEQKFGVPVVHHLTCVGSSFENIDERLIFMQMMGIENILALRGDLPEGANPEAWDFHHADELTAYIRKKGDFCIGGACYPDKHPEAATLEEDVQNLKRKVDAGCEYLTTQLFMENHSFYKFSNLLGKYGIDVPVVAGIMPIVTPKQAERICSLAGVKRPLPIVQALEKFSDGRYDAESFRRTGIEYAVAQIADLYAKGTNNVHLYTMNRADVAEELRRYVAEFLK